MNINIDFADAFSRIPKLPQRQDSLKDQMKDLLLAANRLGLYDAEDWVERAFNKNLAFEGYTKNLFGGQITGIRIKDSECDCEKD